MSKKKTNTNKLKKNTLPDKHSWSDFTCSGPVATDNGRFQGTKIADLLCFSQEKVKKTQAEDSNKVYHAVLCQSKFNSNWFVYVEYGRTGGTNTSFQFTEFTNLIEAEKFYIKQCESKNVKRGQKVQHKILGEIWQAKPGKDFYEVQRLSNRNLRLVDANNISNSSASKIIHKTGDDLDVETQKLFADLGAGTLAYTRNSTVGSIIPAQAAIDEVRLLLDECTKLTNKLHQDDYQSNKELRQLSTLVYGRIPKKKQLNSNDWILTPDQIHLWRSDLDSYESALSSNVYESNTSLEALNLVKFKYVPQDSPLGGWIYKWWPNATGNKHTYLGKLSVKNVWYFERIGDSNKLEQYQKSLGKVVNEYEPKFQPERKDKIDHKLYKDTATYSLFHGSRSTNILSIIKESLRLPKELSRSQITGALFGGYLYMASDVKKSVGYTSYKGSYWVSGSGTIQGRGAFMFIVDCCLGKMYRCKYGHSTGPPSGYNSVYAQAGYSGVQNDEHILCNKEAIKLRYLVEFE